MNPSNFLTTRGSLNSDPDYYFLDLGAREGRGKVCGRRQRCREPGAATQCQGGGKAADTAGGTPFIHTCPNSTVRTPLLCHGSQNDRPRGPGEGTATAAHGNKGTSTGQALATPVMQRVATLLIKRPEPSTALKNRQTQEMKSR